MLLTWIVKSVPRSPRAFLALLVMVGSIGLAFSALTELFVPASVSASRAGLQFVAGLIIGVPATMLFYYFQSLDEHRRHKAHESELETLNRYMKSEERQRIYRQSKATPVFDSHGGPVEPKKVTGQSDAKK